MDKCESAELGVRSRGEEFVTLGLEGKHDKRGKAGEEQHRLRDRHRAAAERMAWQLVMTVQPGANAKSTSTAVSMRALPRLSALCSSSRLALLTNTSLSSAADTLHTEETVLV